MIRLRLDGDRVLGWNNGDLGDGILVDMAPPSPCTDYRYVGGEYIHDPLPVQEDPVDEAQQKLGALLELVTVRRVQSDKLGYDWRVVSIGTMEVSREYIAQEDPSGTADNPITWEDGMEPILNAYYLRDGVRYVWMGEWVEF